MLPLYSVWFCYFSFLLRSYRFPNFCLFQYIFYRTFHVECTFTVHRCPTKRKHSNSKLNPNVRNYYITLNNILLQTKVMCWNKFLSLYVTYRTFSYQSLNVCKSCIKIFGGESIDNLFLSSVWHIFLKVLRKTSSSFSHNTWFWLRFQPDIVWT